MEKSKFYIIVSLVCISAFFIYANSDINTIKNLVNSGKYQEAIKEIENTEIPNNDLNYLAIVCYLNLFDNETLPANTRQEYFTRLSERSSLFIKQNVNEQLVKKTKDDIALKRVQLINSGVTLYNEKKLTSALLSLKQAFILSEIIAISDTSLMYNIAQISYQNNDLTTSKEFIYKLFETGNKKTDAYYLLIDIFKKEKNSNELEAVYKKARENKISNDVLINEEINYYLDKGENAKTLSVLNEIVSQCPSNADYLYTKGIVLENEGDVNAAEDAYNQALRINNSHFKSLFALGNLFLGNAILNQKNKSVSDNYLSGAQLYLEKAENIEPRDKGLLLSLSQLYSLSGDFKKYENIKKKLDQLP